MATNLSVEELRSELAKRGLDTTGTMPSLVQRLEEALLKEQIEEEEENEENDVHIGSQNTSKKRGRELDVKDNEDSKKGKAIEELRQRNVQQFSVKELESCTNEFSDENAIGRGGFGAVYKGDLNGRPIAVKVMKGSAHFLQWCRNEGNILSSLNDMGHPNIIRLIGVAEDEKLYCLVFPLMANRSLEKHSVGLSWEKIFSVINGIASAIQALHDNQPPIVHSDIKAENILLNEEHNAVLTDFGLAKRVGEEFAGSTEDDIYFLGRLRLQLIMLEKDTRVLRNNVTMSIREGALFYKNKNGHAVHERLISEGCKNAVAVALTDLGLECTDMSPGKRPTISNVKRTLDQIRSRQDSSAWSLPLLGSIFSR